MALLNASVSLVMQQGAVPSDASMFAQRQMVKAKRDPLGTTYRVYNDDGTGYTTVPAETFEALFAPFVASPKRPPNLAAPTSPTNVPA